MDGKWTTREHYTVVSQSRAIAAEKVPNVHRLFTFPNSAESKAKRKPNQQFSQFTLILLLAIYASNGMERQIYGTAGGASLLDTRGQQAQPCAQMGMEHGMDWIGLPSLLPFV
jgi:hypothetical protein